MTADQPGSSVFPVLFVGHGSPMNAIEDNEFSRGWQEAARALPRPSAILCISAHWETMGSWVTAMPKPRTIYDFGGFPRQLYEAQYPAPGSPWLAQETQATVQAYKIGLDERWGLDHGCWSVLKQMYPKADIPVVQLSLDRNLSPKEHYNLGKELAPLRQKNVLILGSGNIVHNLSRVVIQSGDFSDFNKPFGLDWAIEASNTLKKLIDENDHPALCDYKSLGRSVQLAVPTPEHFLPLLYVLALKGSNETIRYFNDKPLAGSLTMTSLRIG